MTAPRSPGRAAPQALRCAIYTRKSTEQGLEQEFNSLHNQREAGEAYIKSQAHEGWRLLPAAYDDGGASGGSLDRPSLQRLLAEVRAGRVDVIVVYKVDRLTRSLADFAKLVELFDQHGVSFVSVTQAFNTTTSMGRLTLNVLLSFAQFEREVTGERIRDKIAASKRKGKRVGGPVPLGYRLENKKLMPCSVEAQQVRLIFTRYRELGSLRALLAELDSRGLLTKARLARDGSTRGAVRFNTSGLSYLLRNRCYLGEVVHKGRYYPGEHEPIVDRKLFDAVNAALCSRSPHRLYPNANRDSLLKGLLHDERGHRMTPSSSRSRGPLYRYYISRPATEGRRGEAAGLFRVSAPEIEAKVIEAVGAGEGEALHLASPDANRDSDSEAPTLRQRLLARVERVTLVPGELRIAFRPGEDGEVPPKLAVPFTPSRGRVRRAIVDPTGSNTAAVMTGAQRARLMQGIANGRRWLEELVGGTMADSAAIAAREGCSERHVRMVLNLAFLPPSIVRAAVEGRLPAGHGIVSLSDPPLIWTVA